MTTPIVSARGLRKSFGRMEILHGLDFDIPPGRIYGLIGHNGAGKTTTLNAMLGLTSYNGMVEVLGLDPYRHRARLMQDVAFISDVASLPRFLKVRELFRMLTDIHPNFSAEKAVSFLDGTEVRQGALIGHLSKGMLAQLHLAVVLAIDARLLVLDEPTLGLDITYRKRFYRRLLEEYMSAERTLLITNAYFVPSPLVRRLLTDAAERGVDVRVLVPGPRTDVASTRWAGRGYYGALMQSGVRIFEYDATMMHAKTIVADGVWSVIGSMNLDNRSTRVNDEAALLVHDEGVGATLDSLFAADLSRAREITLADYRSRPLWERMLEWATWLATPVL
jgi:ABC-type Mn2+/Zn2+ transport system ATPase subunit